MPEFDPRSYAYPSRRNVVYARKAMACTSIPQGGPDRAGCDEGRGNAVDAAGGHGGGHAPVGAHQQRPGLLTASPWCGWEAEKKLYGLNASGVAPAAPVRRPGAGAGASDDAPGRLDPHHGARRSGGVGGAEPALRDKAPAPAVCPGHLGRPGGRSRPGEPGAHVGGRDARRIAAAMERDPSPTPTGGSGL